MLDREYFTNIDLKEQGYLDGLNDEHKIILKAIYDKINLDLIKDDKNLELAHPVIRRIFSKIFIKELQVNFFKNRNIEENLNLIDVDDILIELNLFLESDLSIFNLLPNLDIHLELVLLFTQNYIFTLIKRNGKY